MSKWQSHKNRSLCRASGGEFSLSLRHGRLERLLIDKEPFFKILSPQSSKVSCHRSILSISSEANATCILSPLATLFLLGSSCSLLKRDLQVQDR